MNLAAISGPCEMPIATIDRSDELLELLARCGLPTDDLTPDGSWLFYGCRVDGKLAGCVGLECCGSAALLRSLAVARDHRGKGLGRVLVAHAEARASARNIETLFLLTTAAAPFFADLDYRPIERNQAPESIRATRQFAGLCPASATLMRKALGHSNNGDCRSLERGKS